jgi:hypothetical protein
LQFVPFIAFGFEQTPVAGLHVPATWHASCAVQTTGFAPVQTPLTQDDDPVHASLSLQFVPFIAFGFEHTPVTGSHTPATWHWSLAVQVTPSHGCEIRQTFSSWIDQLNPALAVIEILKKRAVWSGKVTVTNRLVPIPVATAVPQLAPSFDTNTE